MSRADYKVICGERRCDWRGEYSDLLTAANPFDSDETLTACPKCKDIYKEVEACEEPKCWEPATCGSLPPLSKYHQAGKIYRRTCYKHQPTPS